MGGTWPEPAMPAWPELAMPAEVRLRWNRRVFHRPAEGGTFKGVNIMSAIRTVVRASAASEAEHRAPASIAFGRKRGYYRVLFDAGPVDAATFAELAGVPEHLGRAWLDEQLAAGLLRVVRAPDGERDELLLPGEYVPILLGDHGEPDFEGARALLDQHRAEAERVRALADTARPTSVVYPEHPSPS
jgi:hypothetical protein